MIELNQRKTSTVSRPFEYKLPSFLAKNGDCYFKVSAMSHEECSARMKPVYEDLVNTLKSRELFLKTRLDRETAAARSDDMDNDKATAPYDRFQMDSTIAQQRFLRGLTMGCFDNCFESWDTNIYDKATKDDLLVLRESFEELARMAYPDKAFAKSKDILTLFEDMRADILDLDGLQEKASKDVQEQDEGN